MIYCLNIFFKSFIIILFYFRMEGSSTYSSTSQTDTEDGSRMHGTDVVFDDETAMRRKTMDEENIATKKSTPIMVSVFEVRQDQVKRLRI